MVRVSLEIRRGATRFEVRVQASSIQRAVSFVKCFYSAGDVRVLFLTDAEAFFVKDPAARAEIASLERAEGMAA